MRAERAGSRIHAEKVLRCRINTVHVRYMTQDPVVIVQKGTKRYVNLAKQDPGMARQSSQARPGTKFSQPRTSLFVSLCTYL